MIRTVPRTLPFCSMQMARSVIFWRLWIEGRRQGDERREVEIRVGNCLPLRNIPIGASVHNIEMKPGKGGQLVRSAGNSAQLMAKEGKYATLRLPSGEMRMVPIDCRATIGQVGNQDHELIKIGKAGRKRHMGIRPTVRGSVMNPNDHTAWWW